MAKEKIHKGEKRVAELTPMMQQYIETKKQYQDCILFYRLGDFYEMFFEDALTASRELEITLTGKNCGQEEKAPMCGVPYHAVEGYLNKLDGLTQEEADDIARIVGLGALKYFILKVDARKNMTFNPKESIDFNGNTGPFIQYTYARIQSVLRKAAESGIVVPEQIPAGIELGEKEEGLIQMVADFAAVVKQAGEDYSPSIIANYTYDLVKEYNQFYHDFSIFRKGRRQTSGNRILRSFS